MARQKKPEPVQYCVGHLTDEFETVAGYVLRLTGDGNCVVWVDVDASVNAAVCSEVVEWPSDWLVGVYSIGADTAQIAEDLEAIRQQWTRLFAS